MRLKVELGDKEFYIDGIVKLYKEVVNKYNIILDMVSDVLNGKYGKIHRFKKIYSQIKSDIQTIYSDVIREVDKEFKDLVQYLDVILKSSRKYGVLEVTHRIKECNSLIEKMFRSSVKIEPGKAPMINDLLGLKIIVHDENASYLLTKKVNEIILSSPYLTFFIENLTYKEKKSSSFYEPEVVFDYRGDLVQWKGFVVEEFTTGKKAMVNIIQGISPEKYKALRSQLKCLAQKTRSKSQSATFCKYLIKEKKVREVFRSDVLYIHYDPYTGKLYFVIPQGWDKIEEMKWIYSQDVISLYDLLKLKKVIRPHYAIEKAEIPLLFHPLGFRLRTLNPWEKKIPPSEVIIAGNESNFYSAKIAYCKLGDIIEAVPLLEIQILDKRHESVFKRGAKYAHPVYKKREKEKTEKMIDILVEKSSTPEKKKGYVKKMLKSIYREFASSD